MSLDLDNPPTSGLPYILPLDAPLADLLMAGGKGANLARLARKGFPVPDGFIITTQAYRDFITANRIEERIMSLLEGSENAVPGELENLSIQIRALFSAGSIAPDLAVALESAYARLGEPAVAVRSSATAEDLPEMSFAGQQDTYLNVHGREMLLKAVVDCWSSLWTARAIGYRARNRVPHRSAALAVVVQQMVESRASGVLFTANPLTGLRSEIVIDATLGLGEALVSGKVEPDHYVVDPARRRILSKKLGVKRISIHSDKGGGTRQVEEDRSNVQALPDEEVLALADLGRQVGEMYGSPQDIEWAWANGSLHLLQTRPITSLFPLPDNLPAEPLKVFFSFGAVQGMLEPMTPLGRDAIRQIFAGASGLFGIEVTAETQTVLYTAGERLWGNFTTPLKNSVGRRVVPVLLGTVEPSVRQAVEQILDDPRLQPGKSGISLRARAQLARFVLPMVGKVLLNYIAPRRRRAYIVQGGERFLEEMQAHCAAIRGDAWQKLAQRAGLLPGYINQKLGRTFTLFVSGVASGVSSWNFLNRLVSDRSGEHGSEEAARRRDLVLQVTRGMPNNPTTEMDLALWEMAKVLKKDAPSFQTLRELPASACAARYLADELPPKAMQAVRDFLARYGGRGFGEIDLGRRRWAQDPTHVFEMLTSFLQIEDESAAPDAAFARAALSAEEAVAQIAALVRRERLGWLKAALVRFFASRVRLLMGLRESPKFFAVRMMALIQCELLKSGQELVQMGELEQADDLFYLTFGELAAFAARQPGDWHRMVAERRSAYHREFQRRQIPRLLLSDGRAFYEGMTNSSSSVNVVMGSPVSPGMVESRVRVVLDPGRANLLPGEIMVCPGTDPSWTPLFLSAGGLVMETGGLMTHGAVVAREYGIPAVVGVDRATTRLRTGQRIRLNGSSGEITLLEETGDVGGA